MRVTMLRNPSSKLGCDLKERETGTVSKELGEKLLKLKIAVPADDSHQAHEAKKEEINAVPPKAEVGKAENTDINKQARKG